GRTTTTAIRPPVPANSCARPCDDVRSTLNAGSSRMDWGSARIAKSNGGRSVRIRGDRSTRRTMKKYLLSIYQPEGDPPENLDEIMEELEGLNREMQAA